MKKYFMIVAVCSLCSVATASIISHSDTVNFVSSGQPAANLTLPSFDTNLGTLTAVTVEFTHSGSVRAMADNDDAYHTGTVSAQMVRAWNASGPGILASGSKTINAGPVALGLDDGDGGDTWSFDPSTPDGFDFSPLLVYANEAASGSPFTPTLSLYESAGPGTVSFTIAPTQMINKLQWIGDAPDVWQQKVERPEMAVQVKVTYEYNPIPEPTSLLFLGLGMIPLLRRRSI